jgi:hypothetical protein
MTAKASGIKDFLNFLMINIIKESLVDSINCFSFALYLRTLVSQG